MALLWAELERGAVTVTCLCSLKSTPQSSLLWYFRKLRFPESTAPACVWVWSAGSICWRGAARARRRQALCLLSSGGTSDWLCVLCGSSNCWTQPSSRTSAAVWGSWVLRAGVLMAFRSREGRGFLLVLNLGWPHLPLFGILALQLLKQEIVYEIPSEISSDDFCLVTCTLCDTGDERPLMGKSSITEAPTR